MINLINSNRDNLLAVEVSGKISKEEVEKFRIIQKERRAAVKAAQMNNQESETLGGNA